MQIEWPLIELITYKFLHRHESIEHLYGCFQIYIGGKPPKSSIFNRVFHYKPSILGYPYFWKHPFVYIVILIVQRGIADVDLGSSGAVGAIPMPGAATHGQTGKWS